MEILLLQKAKLKYSKEKKIRRNRAEPVPTGSHPSTNPGKEGARPGKANMYTTQALPPLLSRVLHTLA